MSRCLGGRSFTTRSPMRMSPEEISSSPAVMRSAVVFPEPDGPTRTRNSPSATSRLSRSTASVPSGKLFETSANWIDAISLARYAQIYAKSRLRASEARRIGLRVDETGLRGNRERPFPLAPAPSAGRRRRCADDELRLEQQLPRRHRRPVDLADEEIDGRPAHRDDRLP